jgi:hypothetical protein
VIFTLWPLACSNSGTSSIRASFAEMVLNTTSSAPFVAPAVRLMTIAPVTATEAIREKCILASPGIKDSGIRDSGFRIQN